MRYLFDGLFPMIDLLNSNSDFFNSKSTGITTNGNSYTAAFKVPGFTEDEINIEVKSRYLEVNAIHKEDSEYKHLRHQITKSIMLPEDINNENITALLKNGILTITVPRKEIEECKKVPILTP